MIQNMNGIYSKENPLRWHLGALSVPCRQHSSVVILEALQILISSSIHLVKIVVSFVADVVFVVVVVAVVVIVIFIVVVVVIVVVIVFVAGVFLDIVVDAILAGFEKFLFTSFSSSKIKMIMNCPCVSHHTAHTSDQIPYIFIPIYHWLSYNAC